MEQSPPLLTFKQSQAFIESIECKRLTYRLHSISFFSICSIILSFAVSPLSVSLAIIVVIVVAFALLAAGTLALGGVETGEVVLLCKVERGADFLVGLFR